MRETSPHEGQWSVRESGSGDRQLGGAAEEPHPKGMGRGLGIGTSARPLAPRVRSIAFASRHIEPCSTVQAAQQPGRQQPHRPSLRLIGPKSARGTVAVHVTETALLCAVPQALGDVLRRDVRVCLLEPLGSEAIEVPGHVGAGQSSALQSGGASDDIRVRDDSPGHGYLFTEVLVVNHRAADPAPGGLDPPELSFTIMGESAAAIPSRGQAGLLLAPARPPILIGGRACGRMPT